MNRKGNLNILFRELFNAVLMNILIYYMIHISPLLYPHPPQFQQIQAIAGEAAYIRLAETHGDIIQNNGTTGASLITIWSISRYKPVTERIVRF